MPQPEQAPPEARLETASRGDAGPPENAREVERHGDETTLGDAPATLVRSAIVHAAPKGGGREVTLLLGGTDVAQVAEHDGAILVLFSDPRDPSRDEMGWIPASAIRPPRSARCTPPAGAVVTALGTFCATPCPNARGCDADEACVSAGTPVAHAGRITSAFSYCIER